MNNVTDDVVYDKRNRAWFCVKSKIVWSPQAFVWDYLVADRENLSDVAWSAVLDQLDKECEEC